MIGYTVLTGCGLEIPAKNCIKGMLSTFPINDESPKIWMAKVYCINQYCISDLDQMCLCSSSD